MVFFGFSDGFVGFSDGFVGFSDGFVGLFALVICFVAC